MVGYLGVTRQPGDVEPEIGHLGPAIHRPAAIPQGLDGGAELLQRVQHSGERHTLWQSRWPASLTEDSACFLSVCRCQLYNKLYSYL
jgi:hypothetical protein